MSILQKEIPQCPSPVGSSKEPHEPTRTPSERLGIMATLGHRPVGIVSIRESQPERKTNVSGNGLNNDGGWSSNEGGPRSLIIKLEERSLSLDEVFRLLAEYRENIGRVENTDQNTQPSTA